MGKFLITVPIEKMPVMLSDLEEGKKNAEKLNKSKKFGPIKWMLAKAMSGDLKAPSLPGLSTFDYKQLNETQVELEWMIMGDMLMKDGVMWNKVDKMASKYGATTKQLEK